MTLQGVLYQVYCADCRKPMVDSEGTIKLTSARLGMIYAGPSICQACVDDRWDGAVEAKDVL